MTAAALTVMTANAAYALDSDGKATISLTDGIIVNKEQGEAKEFTQETLQDKIEEQKALDANAEANGDGGGFLSFFSFSFFNNDKKELPKPEQNETQENFMERLYRQADKGDIDAMISLGYMNLYGLNGVPVNYKKAFEYYSRAAQSGDDVAINNLGSLYYSGVGVRKNISKAAELFSEASDRGNVEASLNLAVIYLSQNDGLGNKETAVSLLKKTAKDDNPVGKYLLGYAYLKGIGVPKNYKKAVENIRFAADKNYDEAQYIMGYLYEHGIGITQNYNNALRYFNRAANQGNISAIKELGELYAAGKRIEKDYHKAHVMFNLAAFYGVPDAAKKRELLAEQLKISELLQAQTEAESFNPRPSKLTSYVKATFGDSLALYIDPRAPVVKVAQ